MTQYRSLQQIAAQNLHRKFDDLVDDMVKFGAMTSPMQDSIEKVRRVQRRIAEHMHKDDRHD